MSRTEWTGGEIARVNAQDLDMYVFAFSPNGTGAPANVTSRRDGMIASVVYNTTGLFTVTMVDSAPGNFVGGNCAVLSTGAGAMRGFSAEFDGTNSTFTAGTVSIALYGTSNTLANATAGAGEYVLVTMYFSKNPLTTI